MPLHRSAYQIRGLSWPRKSMPKPFFSCAVPSLHGLSAAALCTSKPFPLRGCSFPVRSMAPFFFSHAGQGISPSVRGDSFRFQGGAGQTLPVRSRSIPKRCFSLLIRCKAHLVRSFPFKSPAVPLVFGSEPFRFVAKCGHANPFHCTAKQFLFGGKHRFSGAVRFQSLQILRDARRGGSCALLCRSTQGHSGANRFLSAPERCGDPRCTAAAAPGCSHQGRGCTSM